MKTKRYINIVLTILLLLNLFSCISVSAATSVTTIIACSDFQTNSGYDAGKVFVEGLLDVIKEDGITSADGFFCCGDYDTGYSQTKKGIDTLKSAIDGFVTGDAVFVQGNHDTAIGTNGISLSGNNDPKSGAYGVFVINEDDYMWYNNDEARIKQTAQNLSEYLNVKLDEGFDKPIFVLSHLPLNYNMRTHNDGDGRYAKYIFDVLNTAGKKGLNIVFMFGHDHSNGWDDYLGGSSVYLKKGDSINIADYSKTEFSVHTLNFTYMNAGYIGYYNNENGADDTLTMSVIKIYDDSFTVSRYDSSGKHLLKSKGVTNSYKNETAYEPDLTEYTSPQSVVLTDINDLSPIPDVIEKRYVGAKYKLVTDVSDLKDGAEYLFLHKGTSDYVMKPVVVTKANSSGSTRTGYDIEATGDFIYSTCISDFADSLWTLRYRNNAWYIGCEGGEMSFVGNSSTSATATLASTGDPITVQMPGDKFTFTNGTYYLNYNSRGLINGYNSNPAEFYLYEFLGNTVTVAGGTSTKESAYAGDEITVQLSGTDKCFDKWETSHTVDFDTSSKMLTFIMPDHPIEFIPVFNTSHAWSEYVYNDDATKESDGTETRTCENCFVTETKTAVGTKLPSGDIADDRLPKVILNDTGNGVVTDMLGSWATRVYWGYIGTEYVDYKWFEEFRLMCGADYTADFAPRDNKAYYFTKVGYYRFVLKCIVSGDSIDNYKYKDMVYTFYYDGTSEVGIPSLTKIDGNTVRVNENGINVKKLYYGNIGEENVTYSWFNDFWDRALKTKTYTPVFTVYDGDVYNLVTAGYYNFVLVYEKDGTMHEVVYTVHVEENAPVLEKTGQAVTVNLDAVPGAVANRVYWGCIGQDNVEYTTYEDFKTLCGSSFSADFSVKNGDKYAMNEAGYYRFVVRYTLTNGKVIDVVYTIENL